MAEVQVKECNRCGTGNLHWETADDGRYKLYHSDDKLHICKTNGSSNGYTGAEQGPKKTKNKSFNFNGTGTQITKLEGDVKMLKTELDLMHDEIIGLQTKLEEYTTDVK